jgi:hypothetical protein
VDPSDQVNILGERIADTINLLDKYNMDTYARNMTKELFWTPVEPKDRIQRIFLTSDTNVCLDFVIVEASRSTPYILMLMSHCGSFRKAITISQLSDERLLNETNEYADLTEFFVPKKLANTLQLQESTYQMNTRERAYWIQHVRKFVARSHREHIQVNFCTFQQSIHIGLSPMELVDRRLFPGYIETHCSDTDCDIGPQL